MIHEVDERLAVILEFEPNNNPHEVDALTKRMQDIGGSIACIAVSRTLEGYDFVPPYLITEIEFREWVNNSGYETSAKWVSRNWAQYLQISNHMASDAMEDDTEGEAAKHTVNLHYILEYIRLLESGERLRYGLGSTGWNLIAAVINERLSDDGTILVLPWVPAVHDSLRSSNQETRQRAASSIRQFYIDEKQYRFDI